MLCLLPHAKHNENRTHQQPQTPKVMLVTEDEARRMFFSPECRPSPKEMVKLRKSLHLPALEFEHQVMYWTDELEQRIRALKANKRQS